MLLSAALGDQTVCAQPNGDTLLFIHNVEEYYKINSTVQHFMVLILISDALRRSKKRKMCAIVYDIINRLEIRMSVLHQFGKPCSLYTMLKKM